jgi:hypothetical protein
VPPYPTTAQPFGPPGMQLRDPRMGTAGLLGELGSPTSNVKGRRTGDFDSPLGPMLQQMMPHQVREIPRTQGLNQVSILTQLAWNMAQTQTRRT